MCKTSRKVHFNFKHTHSSNAFTATLHALLTLKFIYYRYKSIIAKLTLLSFNIHLVNFNKPVIIYFMNCLYTDLTFQPQSYMFKKFTYIEMCTVNVKHTIYSHIYTYIPLTSFTLSTCVLIWSRKESSVAKIYTILRSKNSIYSYWVSSTA
jgi:hypothetical protein